MNTDGPIADQTLATRIISSLTDGVAVFSTDGRILAANPALLAMLGLKNGNPINLEALFPSTSELYHLATQALTGNPAQDEEIHHRLEHLGRFRDPAHVVKRRRVRVT